MIPIYIGMTGMTLRGWKFDNKSVILNLFRDCFRICQHTFLILSKAFMSVAKGTLHSPSAFYTPNNALLGFEVFSGLLRQRLWW